MSKWVRDNNFSVHSPIILSTNGRDSELVNWPEEVKLYLERGPRLAHWNLVEFTVSRASETSTGDSHNALFDNDSFVPRLVGGIPPRGSTPHTKETFSMWLLALVKPWTVFSDLRGDTRDHQTALKLLRPNH